MMSIYPDLRKMAFGSTDRHNLVAMSWRNVFVLVIFLNLVSTRKIPPTDGDTIQISLDSTNNNTLQKVPAFSNVLLRCSLENPSWYRNNDRIGHEGKRMRSIRIDKIRRSDSGEYGCLSLKGEWTNITLEVTYENSKQINIPSNIQTLSSVMEPPADSLTVPTDSDPIIRIKSFNRKDTNVRNLVRDDFQETMAAVTEDIDFNTSEDFTSSIQGRSPPVFKRLIENEITKRANSEVALSCPAFGSPHPNITWIKENSTLNRKLGKIRIKGWSMIIKDSTADDSGIYKCEICNTEGCISHRIHVIISVPDHTPKIINPPHNLTLITGETGEIKCKYTSDIYSQVTWKFGPCHFTNNCTENDINKQIELNNYPMDSIQLKNVSHEDEGWYTCTVKNSMGSVSAPVYLQIVDDTPIEMDPSEPEETAPKFKNKEMPYTLPRPSGSYIKLSCLATGNPAPETNWTKDGKPINRSFGKVTYKKFAMSMEDVITEDSGIYKCDVCNIHGCIHHETKLIITDRVSHKPIIIKLPENVTVPYHGTAEMACEVLITMFHHSIQWFYGCGPNCPDYNNSREVKTDSENSGLLRIENVTHEDEGWYTCIAANTLGVTTASGYLHVVNELIDKTLISEPIKNHSIWIIIVTTAITLLFLLGTVFIFFIMRKLKHEKLMKHRMETVHQWTKRVVIYKPSADPGCAETLVIPIIKIEKQRTTLLQSSNTDPIPFNEYEFPLDSNWEIPRSQLILGRTLGEGAFGRVVMAEAHGLGKSSNSCIVAVKMVKEGHTDADMASLVREMEVMKMIGKHINIINLLGCCSQEGPLYVIVEYAPHGNLKDFLKKNRPSDFDVPLYDDKDFKHLTQKDLISFAFQVARGMEYLASRRCIHRDLAARNVLVSDDYVIKIADFGLARDIQDTDYYRKNTNGRLPIKWMAPESLQEKFYDTKSDVWSYGVLLWEIMTFGEQPYPQIMSAEELYNYLMSGQRMEKPQRCSLNIYMLMRQCWNFDAHARPTFSEIVENLDKILTATANANEEYLDLGVPLLETPPSSSDDESDTETLRETSPLRYRY